MNKIKEEFEIKNETIEFPSGYGEMLEVCSEVELEYNDGTHFNATRIPIQGGIVTSTNRIDRHTPTQGDVVGRKVDRPIDAKPTRPSIRPFIPIMQPERSDMSYEGDESDSERHYIRFDDDDEIEFESSESEIEIPAETVKEDIDPVERGMRLIFDEHGKGANTSMDSNDDSKKKTLKKKVKVQPNVGLVTEEVVALIKKENTYDVDSSEKRSIRGRACKINTSVEKRKTRLTRSRRAVGNKLHLGPNDSLVTIENIGPSNKTDPVTMVVRNMDSETPYVQNLIIEFDTRSKAKPMVTVPKLDKSKKKKVKQNPTKARESKGSTFPRIRLKDNAPLQCVLCNMECTNRKSLIEHVKSHSADKKSFECPTCKKTFTQQCNLKRHMRCHSGERPFSCPYCKKLFADQGYLTTHLRYHTNTKPYTCKDCDKSFFDRSNYIKHLKSHSGEKPYPCPICKKSFLQQSDLTRHTRVHSGERPFKCTSCERSFTQHGDLTTHLRHHTGERPFICSYCQKTFANKRYLNSHVKGQICLKRKTATGTGKDVKPLTVVPKRATIIKKEWK